MKITILPFLLFFLVFLNVYLIRLNFIDQIVQKQLYTKRDDSLQNIKGDQSNKNNYTFTNVDYIVQYEIFYDVSNIILGSNLEKKLSSDEIFILNGCNLLINAGFYTKDLKHIGLFRIDNHLLSEYKDLYIHNGVVSIENSLISISNKYEDSSNSFQSGPILIFNGLTRKINIRNDKFSRRLVLAQINNGNVYLVIYNRSNYLLGPKLEELPSLIKEFGEAMDLNILNAINLDGGSASSFITKDFKIREIVTIGGYLCLI